MATLSNEEIEQLQQQLKEKQEEVKEIYDKLMEAGGVPLPDDFLDGVAGGFPIPTSNPSYSQKAPTPFPVH